MLQHDNKQLFVKTGYKLIFFYCVIIAAITFIAFLPSLRNGFTDWDDREYVVHNSDIQGFSVHNLAKVFSSSYVNHYLPLTMLTYMAEYQFFQLNPAIYHFTNLLFHIINCLLVFALIYCLSGKYLTSFLVAMLFAIHPLRVESVVWVAERKDVLSSFFTFLSLLSYIWYINKGARKFYYLCGLSFLFSLLSKPMAVSQPFVLLLIFYLKNGRLNKKAITETVPFFIIASIFVVIALFTQNVFVPTEEKLSLSIFQRICIPFYGISFYLIKSILPLHLCAFYPFPEKSDTFLNFMLIASPFLVISIVAVVYYFRNHSRKLVFGSLFFLVTALPVLQIVITGNVMVAERYTYIPMLGIYFIFADFLSLLITIKWNQNKTVKNILITIISIILLIFCAITYERCNVWKNSLSLWNDVLAKFPVAIAFNSRGVAYGHQGDYNDAIEDFNQAIQINPTSALAYNNRGLAYNDKGDHDRAIDDFSQAVKLNPIGSLAYNNRGLVYKVKGDYDRAIEDFSQAIKLNPRNFDTYYNRGLTYNAKGDFDHAIEDFSQAIKINPMNAQIYNNRGLVYKAKGDGNRAIEDYSQAIRINPHYTIAYINRGVAYCIKADYYIAIEDFTKAINLSPNSMQGYFNRGLAYKAIGDLNHALDDIKMACSLGLEPACKMISN
jgi:tetratricopeptide (TPR) repeat protein